MTERKMTTREDCIKALEDATMDNYAKFLEYLDDIEFPNYLPISMTRKDFAEADDGESLYAFCIQGLMLKSQYEIFTKKLEELAILHDRRGGRQTA